MEFDSCDGSSVTIQLLSYLGLNAKRKDSFGRQPGIIKAVSIKYHREEYPLVTFEVVEHRPVRRRLFPIIGKSRVRKPLIPKPHSLESRKIR